jgi:hypothetical protein
MALRLTNLLFLIVVIGAATVAFSQPPDMPDASTRAPGTARRADSPFALRDMIAKQRAERDKKDHETMLERGDEALRLTKQLEVSFQKNNSFSETDREKLESLEKVVSKIRKELGGDDDSDEGANSGTSEDEPKMSTMEEAFKYLRSTTVKLVDELKKTTRFSISAAAIHSSNTVIKLARFLRLRK